MVPVEGTLGVWLSGSVNLLCTKPWLQYAALHILVQIPITLAPGREEGQKLEVILSYT